MIVTILDYGCYCVLLFVYISVCLLVVNISYKNIKSQKPENVLKRHKPNKHIIKKKGQMNIEFTKI